MSQNNENKTHDILFRASLSHDEESNSYSGYGIVFGSDSVPMRIWDEDRGVVNVVEQISRDSLNGADMTDVIAAINHDFSQILGRTTAGTLELSVDDNGVLYRVPDMPDTTYANDLVVSTSRGDYQGSSFTFSMDSGEGYDITERSDGSLLAIPKRITKVYEMGPVTTPAYPETTAQNRSNFLTEAVSNYLTEQRQENKEENESDNCQDDERMKDFELRLRLMETEATL